MQDAAFGGARFTLENDSKLAYENHFHEMALAAVVFASCREIVDDILVKLELKGFVIASAGMEPPSLCSDRAKPWDEFSDMHGNSFPTISSYFANKISLDVKLL